MSKQKRYLTYKDLQELKGVDLKMNALRRLCRAGKFPMPFQLSARRLIWDEDEVDEHIQNNLRRTA